MFILTYLSNINFKAYYEAKLCEDFYYENYTKLNFKKQLSLLRK